jgi:formylglycine-generating enzyme required for sulfatase activity
LKSHHLFIIIALPFIFILFFLKWDTNHLELNSSIELPRHILIKTKEHSFSLTSRPISNHQFHTFVEHTGFKSWRELHDVFPNWEKESYYSLSKNWEVKASDPVLWLTQKDALQFCLWMDTQFKQITFELPSCKELEEGAKGAFFNKEQWYWTKHTYLDFNSTFSRNSNYATAWSFNSSLKHRREKDLENSSAITFLIKWNINE